MQLKVKRLNHAIGLPELKYQSDGASGFDLYAAFAEGCFGVLFPNEQLNVPTGFCFEVPEGFELQIRARSGLAFKEGVGIVNGVGTIDADYRGEVWVCLTRMSKTIYNSDHVRDWGTDTGFKVTRGMRIAQAVLCPVTRGNLIEVNELSDTVRGEGGFGSTGV